MELVRRRRCIGAMRTLVAATLPRSLPTLVASAPPRVSIGQFGIVRRLHAFEISWRKR